MPKDPNSQSITIRKSTLERLAIYKHCGQSWDGTINEIIDELTIWEDKRNKEHEINIVNLGKGANNDKE